jgi:hypothetical protein
MRPLMYWFIDISDSSNNILAGMLYISEEIVYDILDISENIHADILNVG